MRARVLDAVARYLLRHSAHFRWRCERMIFAARGIDGVDRMNRWASGETENSK